MSIRFYCALHLLFYFYDLFRIRCRGQCASTRFMKDAYNGLQLRAFLPTLNHPEQRKRCFIIGLKEILTENVPNVENRLRVIMVLLACTADGAT